MRYQLCEINRCIGALNIDDVTRNVTSVLVDGKAMTGSVRLTLGDPVTRVEISRDVIVAGQELTRTSPKLIPFVQILRTRPRDGATVLTQEFYYKAEGV